jgi:hypothetical protein
MNRTDIIINRSNGMYSAGLIAIALAIPTLGKVTPLIKDLSYNLANYSIIILIIAFLIDRIIVSRTKRIYFICPEIFLFSLYIIAISIIKGLIGSDLQNGFSQSVGPLFGIIAGLHILGTKSKWKSSKRYWEIIGLCLAPLFVAQIFLSIYESIMGFTLGDYEIKIIVNNQFSNKYGAIINRDPLALVGLTLGKLIGLQMPITGLIGQHNYFGGMLVLYNLIFLIAGMRSGRRLYYGLAIIAFMAAIANTTRIGLVAIIITDIIIIWQSIKIKHSIKLYIAFIMGILVLLYIPIIIESIMNTFEMSNTLPVRMDAWEYIYDQYTHTISLGSIIFGWSMKMQQSWGYDYINRYMGSFENQFIAIVIRYGIPVVLLFSIIFIGPMFAKKRIKENIYIVRLLGINVMILCITLDTLLHYSNYVLIILIYLGCAFEKREGISYGMKASGEYLYNTQLGLSLQNQK